MAKGDVGTLMRPACPCVRALALAVAVFSSPVNEALADPIRLRADALAQTEGSASPVGLVALQGQDPIRPWLDAEALVWAGAKPSWTGDVLVLMVRLHEPHGYGELRLGRFVLATGAVHPVQIDGAHAIGRCPGGCTIEAFGGVPVVPRFGWHEYDWIAGARAAQTLASAATLGVSYVQRREGGEVAGEEVGVDLATAPARWLDLAAYGSYDLIDPGLAEARASAAARSGDWRLEVFASQLAPGRLLPATSLFSVLGDMPSQTLGATVRWRAAPRLDLLASGAGQDVAGEIGGNGWVRGTLRLDDRGDGDLGLELRRVDVPGAAQWTGVRAIGAFPLGRGFRHSFELEVVVPDHPDGRGVAWPWALSALSWRSRRGLEIAAAIEASASPLHRYEADALMRVAAPLEIR